MVRRLFQVFPLFSSVLNALRLSKCSLYGWHHSIGCGSEGIFVVQKLYVEPCNAISPFSFFSTSDFSSALKKAWRVFCPVGLSIQSDALDVEGAYLFLVAFEYRNLGQCPIPLHQIVFGEPDCPFGFM